jgi:ubiquinone/menaquinone biosynthesis C-methylase UbiE
VNGFYESNKALWDRRVEPHTRSELYAMEAFRSGATSLNHIEREALGDVRGKSLLHLQCHFGQDSLSWARLGAAVTAVDYSPTAVETARRLARQLDLSARFICSDLYDLPSVLDEQFDIVFTSYGVLKWLPDIDRWGQLVARYVKRGGEFFIVEFHPFLYVFDYDRAERIEHSYFFDRKPTTYEEPDYADMERSELETAHAWTHPVSRVMTALLNAGLQVTAFDEYPYSTIPCFPFLEPAEPGRYVHRTYPGVVPILYSIHARKGA